MLNNEIQRLIRCIVEASAESNVSFEEIQEELAKQFGKEHNPQVYYDIEVAVPSDIPNEEFRKKAKKFMELEMDITHWYDIKVFILDIICIFHELKQETPIGEFVNLGKMNRRFMSIYLTDGNTRAGYFYRTNHLVKWYLKNKKGIVLKDDETVNRTLEVVYPYLLSM